MKTSRRAFGLGAFVAGIAAVALGVAAISIPGGEAKQAGPFTVSKKGTPVHLSKQAARRLADVPANRVVHLLGTRGQSAVYRIGNAQSTCYGTGSADLIGQLGAVRCFEGVRPLMDFSVVEISAADPSVVKFFRVAGVAADHVASVAVIRTDGTLSAQTPVIGNLYVMTTPPTDPAAGLAALDTNGKVVYSQRFR
jgi:hypothetical protein